MDNSLTTPDAQAQRLENVYAQLESELKRWKSQPPLRQTAGENEWSAMQVMGHMVEMIPYWLNACQTLINATGPAPQFGRLLDAPERLEGVERGQVARLDELLAQLKAEVSAAATKIRGMASADRDKQGVHIRRGDMTVAEIIELLIVAHAEEHLAQVRQTLAN